MIARCVAAAIALACAGCASVDDTPAPEPSPRVAATPPAAASAPAPVSPTPAKLEHAAPAEPKTSDLDALLTEFERVRRLPAAELAREQEAARQTSSQARSDASRVKLAMLWSVPGSSPADEQRALEILDPLVKTPGSPMHGLAFLLAAFIQEQRRLAASVQGLQQNTQGLQQNNQALQQNVHGLQQKLDALRTLERSLSERGEPAQRKR
ncbi:MAG TPA: hypothetical protein VGP15_16085 [Burkholderiales bacterium]|nr:hypothetical protein [Burkholderiales bacterium]